MTEQSRLRWQCRRGMRELDQLLLAWLEHDYPHADSAQIEAFQALLALSDPQLMRYLLGGDLPEDPDLVDVIRSILDRTSAQ